MEKIAEQIAGVLKAAFAACGYEEKFGTVSLSNRPDLCQFQCNGAMAAAKQYKKAPIMIAKEVVAQCSTAQCNTALDNAGGKGQMFEKLEAAMPGFINITLSNAYLAEYLGQMSADGQFGCASKAPKTVMIDYGGANVAKPLHIGHLRSAIIGESVKRIKRFMGDKVIGDVHLGDWGLQMGLVIEELRDRKPDLPYFEENHTGEYPSEAPFTLAELEEIYPHASAKSKVDEAFKERAHQATVKLQSGDPGFTAIWKHIMDISVEDLKRNYDNLNVSFDVWKGESDARPYIQEMLADLVTRGIAYESQGALVVDVTEPGDSKELPPCIVRKSDGAAIYATTDLATILEREKLYQPDQYIYLTDKRQELHFTQVFRTARKAGYVKPETEMGFIGFGTMNGKDGKPFKTRDGGVMRLESLLLEVVDAVYSKIMENRTVEESEARKTAQIIGLAAIKYGDLSNQASKDYIFDIEKFVSFEGNTGPYILYTMVRIKSILEKYNKLPAGACCGSNLAEESSNSAGEGNHPVSKAAREYTKAETDLMLIASRFSETIERAAEELAPHKICQYIYEMANTFNSFYHENRIIGEEDKEKQAQWIALITLTLRILEISIDLLGFEAPDRM